MADIFSFQAKVASPGYHVCKETAWRNAMENEKVTVAIKSNEASKQIDPYCCAIQIKSSECDVTVGHIPREISRYCLFFCFVFVFVFFLFCFFCCFFFERRRRGD